VSEIIVTERRASGARAGEAPLVRVADLRVRFESPLGCEQGPVHAVNGVSFELRRGETLALVGESGSGKSVTGLAVLRLLPPNASVSAAAIDFAGTSLLRATDEELRRVRGKRIAMIFQDPSTALSPALTVGGQIGEMLTTHAGLGRAAAEELAAELLARVGIADPRQRLRSYPHELSGGMRQRVLIAMMLACEPEVLIADEPTTALDVTLQAQVLALLAELRAVSRTSVLMITHDLGVVAHVADRVAVMYAGRIVEQAPVETIFARPRHPYTRGLLSSIPRLDTPRGQWPAPLPGRPPDPRRLPSGCPFHPRCPLAEERCRAEVPALVRVGPDHEAACPVTQADRERLAP
jgi:oligopeptide/dipeptide ABC transporter ATP-binding protein